MSLKNIKIGDVLVSKDAMTGYFMVMDYNQKKRTIILSPLFWCEHIVYQHYKSLIIFDEYKKHSGLLNRPLIQARYDHEVMRRLNKL